MTFHSLKKCDIIKKKNTRFDFRILVETFFRGHNESLD